MARCHIAQPPFKVFVYGVLSERTTCMLGAMVRRGPQILKLELQMDVSYHVGAGN